jgi:hypothetical protein
MARVLHPTGGAIVPDRSRLAAIGGFGLVRGCRTQVILGNRIDPGEQAGARAQIAVAARSFTASGAASLRSRRPMDLRQSSQRFVRYVSW